MVSETPSQRKSAFFGLRQGLIVAVAAASGGLAISIWSIVGMDRPSISWSDHESAKELEQTLTVHESKVRSGIGLTIPSQLFGRFASNVLKLETRCTQNSNSWVRPAITSVENDVLGRFMTPAGHLVWRSAAGDVAPRPKLDAVVNSLTSSRPSENSTHSRHHSPSLDQPEMLAKLILNPPRSREPMLVGDGAFDHLTSFCIRADRIVVGRPPQTISIMRVAPESRDNRVDSCEISFDRHGLAPVALILPGFGLSKLSMIQFANALASAGYVAILVDLPGQGASGGDTIGYGLKEADYISDLISHLGVGSLDVLLGYSYGGLVAIAAASRDVRVQRVVAIAPPISAAKAIEFEVRRRYLNESEVDHDQLLGRALALVGETLGGDLAEVSLARLIGENSPLTLLVAGRRDQVTPASDIVDAVAGKAGVSIKIVDGSHHELIVGSEHGIFEIITDWIGEVQ